MRAVVLTCDDGQAGSMECERDFTGGYGCRTFTQVIAEAQRAGWRVYRRRGREWHVCRACQQD